jgi:hypothetical protein
MLTYPVRIIAWIERPPVHIELIRKNKLHLIATIKRAPRMRVSWGIGIDETVPGH